MGIVFDYEKNPNISELDIQEIKNRITKVEDILNKKIPKFLEYLDRQENGDYIEIHWPVFEYGITIMTSKLGKKFLISVLNQNNSKIYGNLIMDGYPCIDVSELKKLGRWSTWKGNKLNIFKPKQSIFQ